MSEKPTLLRPLISRKIVTVTYTDPQPLAVGMEVCFKAHGFGGEYGEDPDDTGEVVEILRSDPEPYPDPRPLPPDGCWVKIKVAIWNADDPFQAHIYPDGFTFRRSDELWRPDDSEV